MKSIVTLPPLQVQVAGHSLLLSDQCQLLETRIQQRLSLPTLCEVRLLVTGDHQPNLSLGSALNLSLPTHPAPLFIGQITAVEQIYTTQYQREIRIRGYDQLYQLRQTSTTGTYIQVTVAELAQEMVTKLALVVAATESGPLWEQIIQAGQSDAELLRTITDRCGLYFTLRQHVLHLFSLKGFGPAQPLQLGDTLVEARIESNSDPVTTAVSLLGWNPQSVETYTSQAEQLVQHYQKSHYQQRSLINMTVQDQGQADVFAQRELSLRSAQAVTLWGVAVGQPALQPGTPVDIDGMPGSPCSRFVLTSVNHLINPHQGYISEISSVPPRSHDRSEVPTLAPGVVSDVDDPEQEGRVKVTLPTLQDVESSWMKVLSPLAGMQKGWVALPNVEDTVLVIFPQGLYTQGIILGCLYGPATQPDWGLDQGRVCRYTFVSPGQQQIQIDDTQGKVRLENVTGSYVELRPECSVVHAQGDLQLEAPNHTVWIRGQSIEFERA